MLARGDTVTYLLRNTKTLEEDEAVRPYIQSGHAVLVKGDATWQADVQNAWIVASRNGPVDFIMFTIGECIAPWLSTSSGMFDPRPTKSQIPPTQGFHNRSTQPVHHLLAQYITCCRRHRCTTQIGHPDVDRCHPAFTQCLTTSNEASILVPTQRYTSRQTWNRIASLPRARQGV